MKISRLDASAADFSPRLASLLAYAEDADEAVERAAQTILADVKARGDAALLEYTGRFDGLKAASTNDLRVSPEDIAAALKSIPAAQREALEAAAARVKTYHEKQKLPSWSYTEADGTMLGQQVNPLDRAGLYVPGGKAAYPSSVLMNAIPAKVAGVGELIMVTPTPATAGNPHGESNPLVLAAAAIVGVDTIYRIGGAQAIGALAYGTETIAQVDKITGPGNAYVTAAKRRVFGTVGIDMIAGPSEILVISDGTADPDWVAMDLFSQAEHDEIAQAILLCPDAAYLDKVAASIDRQIAAMPRAAIITASMTGRGALIKTRDLAHACDIANRIAPEHLELSVADPDALLPLIRHAGAIFMGVYASEALGDYCAGPNHVLPTARTARFSSPLGVYDFQKRSLIIKVSREGARTLGKIASTLAQGEGLPAHAKSAEYRL